MPSILMTLSVWGLSFLFLFRLRELEASCILICGHRPDRAKRGSASSSNLDTRTTIVPKSFGFRYYLQHFHQFERSIVGRTEYGRNGIPPVLTTKQAKYAAENELAGTPAWPQPPGNGIAVAASSTGKETCRFAPQRCPQLSAVQRQVLLHPAKV